MGEPTHDYLARADHLLAVDAQVLPVPGSWHALGTPSDHQAPRNQGSDVTRPTSLDRPSREIDFTVVGHDLAARSIETMPRLHIPKRPCKFQQAPGVSQPSWWFGLPQTGQQFPNSAKTCYIFGTHSEGDASLSPKQIGQNRHRMAAWMLEKQRRPACTQRCVSKCSHLQLWRDRLGHPEQLAIPIEPLQKVPKVTIRHVLIIRN